MSRSEDLENRHKQIDAIKQARENRKEELEKLNKDKKMIGAWLKKNKPKEVKPLMSNEKGQTGSKMKGWD
jgi:hypothetical protein